MCDEVTDSFSGICLIINNQHFLPQWRAPIGRQFPLEREGSHVDAGTVIFCRFVSVSVDMLDCFTVCDEAFEAVEQTTRAVISEVGVTTQFLC